jgi:hypothetical protein
MQVRKESLLDFNDLVILRRDRTDNCVIDSSTCNAIKHIAQDTKLWWQKLSCPCNKVSVSLERNSGLLRTTSATFNKAFQIVAVLQQGINICLHQRSVKLIVSKTPSYPHSARVLQK